MLFTPQYIQTKMYNICKEKIYRVRQSEREGGRERGRERAREIGKERENRKRATKLNQIISLVMVSK